MDRNRNRLAQERVRYDCIDLNLRTLDIFVQVAEAGGISPAARRVGLTQSAVSQIIASLEQSIGAQLLDRNVRPIALTPAGGILLDKARGVLLCAREAIRASRTAASSALPKLNICLVGGIASGSVSISFPAPTGLPPPGPSMRDPITTTAARC